MLGCRLRGGAICGSGEGFAGGDHRVVFDFDVFDPGDDVAVRVAGIWDEGDDGGVACFQDGGCGG